jgi:hypothetical protein
MSRSNRTQEWILLVHQLPPKPTSLRVGAWRKLQKLGAVAVKNSVYVLPSSDKTFEDFQWLKQEIESAGGEATVFRAAAVEGATNDEIIAAFGQARDEEYSLVTAELDGVTGAVREQKRRGHLSIGRLGGYEADLERLHTELERIISIDFFHAAGRAAAVTAYERCQKTLLASQDRKKHKIAATASIKEGSLDLAQFQGRRWMTRKNLFIDRLASIWLIKRFIDQHQSALPRSRSHLNAHGRNPGAKDHAISRRELDARRRLARRRDAARRGRLYRVEGHLWCSDLSPRSRTG